MSKVTEDLADGTLFRLDFALRFLDREISSLRLQSMNSRFFLEQTAASITTLIQSAPVSAKNVAYVESANFIGTEFERSVVLAMWGVQEKFREFSVWMEGAPAPKRLTGDLANVGILADALLAFIEESPQTASAITSEII